MNHLREAFTGQGSMEAAMATKVAKMGIRGNMHMDSRVIEVLDFNSEVKFEI